MTRQRFPIRIQDFQKIRSENFYYVDKTALIQRLVDEGYHYFLSRPRQFGKSLLVDTLASLFEGREDLFRGLAIHPNWDWSSPHPVLRLRFEGRYNEPGDIERDILTQLDGIERRAGLPPSSKRTGPERLFELLYRLHSATGRRVVVLVDTYDRPVLDVLDQPERARAHLDYLLGCYGIVKGCAEHVHFTFMTGVTMLSTAGIFSGLNHLLDISLDPRYATICGFREEDLDRVFGPELVGLDREAIRTSYNGYQWPGGERVYNPYDVLELLDTRKFRSFWSETGSPDFLTQMLVEKSVSLAELEGQLVHRRQISRLDVERIDLEALLFQTGYLTIAEEEESHFDTFYRLDYPNPEVRISLNEALLARFGLGVLGLVEPARKLPAQLEENDFAGFGDTLRAWLSGIPYQWPAKGDPGRYEAWYAGLLHMCLCSVGLDLRMEKASSRDRADMVVHLGDQVFVLKFKMAEDEDGGEAALDAAMEQMRGRRYAEQYRDHGGPVHLIGVACGHETRPLLAVRAEPA